LLPSATAQCRKIIQQTFIAVTESGCPENFHYISPNFCYHTMLTNLQWLSASQYCRALDPRAHLLVINSEEEQEVIANGLRTNPSKF